MPRSLVFGPGELDIDVSSSTRDGRPCVQIEFSGVRLRVALEDALQLSDALARCVSVAEVNAEAK
jgi:hypothetical protein